MLLTCSLQGASGRTPHRVSLHLSSGGLIPCIPEAYLLHSPPHCQSDKTSVWCLSQNSIQVSVFGLPSSLRASCCSPSCPRCKSKDGVKGPSAVSLVPDPQWAGEREDRGSPCLILDPRILVFHSRNFTLTFTWPRSPSPLPILPSAFGSVSEWSSKWDNGFPSQVTWSWGWSCFRFQLYRCTHGLTCRSSFHAQAVLAVLCL